MQPSPARRGVRHVSFTATVTLGRLQPPGIAKSLIKDIHRAHLCLVCMSCSSKGRLAGLLTTRSCIVTYSAGLHTMSHQHHSVALNCAPSSSSCPSWSSSSSDLAVKVQETMSHCTQMYVLRYSIFFHPID